MLGASGAAAEEPRNPEAEPQEPKVKQLDIRGRIWRVNPRYVEVLTDDNQPWRVAVSKDASVSVTGMAGGEALQTGVAIRFEAILDSRGMIEEPVRRITVFSPRAFFQPLLELAQQEPTEEINGDDETSEVDSNNDDPDKPPEVSRRRRRGRSATKVDKPGERYHISGILKSVSRRRGRFTVDVGEAGSIRGRVAEDAVVEADFTSLRFARRGDRVHVIGHYTDPWEAAGVARPENQVMVGHGTKFSVSWPDSGNPDEPPSAEGTTNVDQPVAQDGAQGNQ